MEKAKTLGELIESGYQSVAVKDELRANLICKLKRREKLFAGIVGYDETVVPQLINAILARHNLILLGLRGQAKSRIIRQLTNLLDPQIPIIAGSEVNDNPFHPISAYGRQMLNLHGDTTQLAWVDRDARFPREAPAVPGPETGAPPGAGRAGTALPRETPWPSQPRDSG